MNKFINYFIILIVTLNIANADESAMRGWHYYQDPIAVSQDNKNQEKTPAQPAYASYRDYNEEIKKEFEEIQMKAIYDPTEENIKNYNVALRAISNNAVKFSLLATTQNWQDPDAGISLTAPNGAGLQSDLDKQRKQIAKIIKRYAIFYFIDKKCKYCSVEANELKRLELTYNITVRVISLDGTTLEQYPKPIADKNISQSLGVKSSGVLLAFDSTNSKTTVIGYGYVHFDQIIQRMQTLFISGTSNHDEYLNQKQPIVLESDDEN